MARPNKWYPESFRVTSESDTDSHISGWVSTEDELNNLLEAHRRTCLCSFVSCCIKDVTAQGKVVLLTLPKVMAVHLKRFSNNGAKDRRPMKIEEEIGLRVFVKPGEVLEDKFRLIGVVMHDGIQQENGHYRCFTLHGMQWFEIDDMRVCPVPVRSVKEAQAYMLFYEAMPRCSLDT